MTMVPQTSLIEQLESMTASKDVSRRADILRKVADLFVLGSGRFSEDQIELFDDVMSRLVSTVEQAARAQFGGMMAPLADAPLRVVRSLATDDAIEVAGPVLMRSERLDDATLVESARTKGQDHLLAIAQRTVLVEAVTDVLVERGNSAVVSTTARNAGARFSETGALTLVNKARDDGDLAVSIWSRSDIPRQNLVRLFMDASEAVKSQLVDADPRRADMIKSAVAAASERIRADARARSCDFSNAQSQVRSLHASGNLDEAALAAFVAEASYDKITSALSLMCDLPIELVERVFAQSRAEQLLILARAIDLSWETTLGLLRYQAGDEGMTRQQLDLNFTGFSRLQKKTAQTALQFYRMSEKSRRPAA